MTGPATDSRTETDAPPAKKGPWRRTVDVFRQILQIDDTPESIARGVALGVFIAMTPTVGIQMIIVTIVNTICRANRLAGLVMVYISNPVTMLPIYWFDYQVGRLILGQKSISHSQFEKIFELRGPNLVARLQSFVENLAQFSFDVAGPLFLGGIIVGLVCGIPAYPLTLAILRRHRARKARSSGDDPTEDDSEAPEETSPEQTRPEETSPEETGTAAAATDSEERS